MNYIIPLTPRQSGTYMRLKSTRTALLYYVQEITERHWKPEFRIMSHLIMLFFILKDKRRQYVPTLLQLSPLKDAPSQYRILTLFQLQKSGKLNQNYYERKEEKWVQIHTYTSRKDRHSLQAIQRICLRKTWIFFRFVAQYPSELYHSLHII